MSESEQAPEQQVDVGSTESAPEFRWRHHATFLGLSLFVVVMSLLMVVVSDERVAFRGLENRPLPHSCVFRMTFGTGCPGCGLTRGTIHLANGRLSDAFAMHRLTIVFAVLILAQIPFRSYALVRKEPAPLGYRFTNIVTWILVILLMGNWLLGFALNR